MSNNLKKGLLLATTMGIALSPTQVSAKCCSMPSVKSIGKAITNTANNAGSAITNTANTAVNTVVNTANNVANSTTDAVASGVGYANFATAQAKGYADTVAMETANTMAKASNWSNLAAADTASQAMGFRNYADRMAADSVAVGRDQYGTVRNDALRAYTASSNQAQNTYEDARKAVAPVINTANSVAKYIAGICVNQATSSWGKITPYVNRAQSLDDNGKKALYRVLRTLARGSTPDQQTAADLKAVGVALGMITGNGLALVGNSYQSNFGISVGGSGGWIAGVNSSVSFSMDTFPTNGKYKMAIAVNSGVQVAAGSGDLAPGATIGFGLGWGPGSAVGASGVTLTAGGAVGGIDVAAQWTIPPSLAQVMAADAKRGNFTVDTLKNAVTSQIVSDVQAVCQAPGISAGVSFPSPGNLGDVTFSPGYTHVVWTGEI